MSLKQKLINWIALRRIEMRRGLEISLQKKDEKERQKKQRET